MMNRLCFFTLSAWEDKVFAKDNTLGSFSGPQCECGAHKVYGTNVDPFFHARWCRLFVNNK